MGWAWASLLYGAAPLQALDPAQKIEHFAHTVWSRERGDLPSSITALAQTRDGRLWIGTDAGLVRFDGVHFQAWQPPANQSLPSDRITVLTAPQDGSLWIGTRAGLAHWSHGALRNHTLPGALAGKPVNDILIDSDGAVSASVGGHNTGGVCRLLNGRPLCDTTLTGLADANIYSLLQDRNHSLWASGPNLCRWRPGPPRIVQSPIAKDTILSMLEDPLGQLWAGGIGLKVLKAERITLYPLTANHREPLVKPLLLDRQGALWIGTIGQGLFRVYQGRIEHFTHSDGLSSDVVFCLFEDREGDIWAGTSDGLDRFREYAVTMLSKREGLSQDTIASVFPAHDGGAWIGTAAGLNALNGSRVTTFSTPQGLPSPSILGIFQTQSGRLLAQTTGGLAYSDGARFQRLDFEGHAISLAAAAEDSLHRVWISDSELGLLMMDGSSQPKRTPWSQFHGQWAWSLEPDGPGLWMGFPQGEIAYQEPGRSLQWYTLPGKATTVVDLHKGAQSTLWIATENSLYRWLPGNIAELTFAPPLAGRIQGVVGDDRGGLWIKCTSSLLRISSGELSAWSADPRHRIQPRSYDFEDGLAPGPPQSGYFRRAAKSRDGRLWFPFYTGVAVIDSARLAENPIPPPVEIQALATSQASYPILPGLRLPPLTQEIRIDYAAFSYPEPEKVRFRYKLEGFDTLWHEVSGRQAVYTNLPPKHYQFRVKACNNDGIWNDAGTAWNFAIAPAYYQTNWFRALCFAILVALLGMLHRLRLHQAGQRLSLAFQARLAERTRIAREIHDSLLQNLCGFALQLDALSKNAGLPESLRNRLLDIRHDTERSLQDARKLVWDLRAPALQEVDLAEALRHAGEEITGHAGIPFHMVVSGQAGNRTVPAEFQEQMIRIVQEAARNAVRYSQAQEIRMTLEYAGDGLVRVQVRDDGCGFDLEEASRRSGHWGLITMRERAHQIGGKLSISSAPGRGTEIDILASINS